MMRYIAYFASRTITFFAESDFEALLQAQTILGPGAQVQAG